MKKLTKKQRLELYQKALKYWKQLSKNNCQGFCFFFDAEIKEIFNLTEPQIAFTANDIFYDQNFKRILPELYSTKPDDIEDCFWFDCYDHNSRIKCLEKAIELIKK